MGSTIAVDLRLAGVKAMEAGAVRAWQGNATPKTRLEEKRAFDAQAFLDSAGVARKVVEYGSNVIVYAQGDPATSVLYIQNGSVKITVVNEAGKEAVVAILGPGDFLGEGCLARQTQRVNTAATITRATILVVEKSEMIRLLHTERALSERFIKHMLSRNIRVEEDLIDQLFNHSEKRLARTLLLLAHYGKHDTPEQMVPNISQEVLAEMVGTTRSRVNLFMNKFRKLGFIKYGGRLRGLQIDKSLLSVVLQD
jgi:CRP/FNR family transcriptional regulator, cyclic AMP receptor protein